MMQRPSGGRPPRAPVNKDAIGRAIKYLGRFKRQASLPYIFLVIATLSQLAVPKLVSGIIDAVSTGVAGKAVLDRLPSIPAGAVSSVLPQLLQFLKLPATLTLQQLTDTLNANVASAPSALLTAGIAIVVFSAFRGVFAFLQAYWAEKNSQQVAYDLRNELYEKVQRLSFSYYEKTQTGQLMIRATDDVEKLRLFIGQGLLQIVGALALIVGTLVILFTTNAQLALVVLPLLPVAMGLFMFFGAVSGPLFGKVQMRLSELNAVLQENLAGIKVVQAFVRERSEQERFDASANKLLNQQLQISRLFTFLFPVIFLVANLGQSAVLYFGGRDIVLGNLTIGVWQEFSLYLVYLFLPIAQLGIIVTQLGQAAASATRIFEILDAKSDVVDKPGAPALPAVKGEIAFDNVTFRYIGEGKPVLQNVSFTAHPGETVALLGATGSGKTSIINLLPRFYDPTEGAVKIDGHNLRDVTLESLRAQIGIVLQETTLFSGTIRDNIAYGRSDATMDEVIAAATAASAHDFIMGFPAGYDTPVGERGSTLSGGQKQRVAIARALLLNPRILILDDSTSSVDLATEARIQQALDTLMRNRTSVVIAQRISTVLNADQILVLDKGQIVARGTHKELIEDSPIYAEIYTSQLVGPNANAAGTQPALAAASA
ncbi:MAG TPA: ABC transporter ATP-binding protein [Thermoflexales bacterium]|nr:ABC transporter ATP-binding protein [Thermoflexales bacterium]HQX10293.1 ABC transporter ATP-binding protein [Thermoflexales bacterium]HQZ54800.1 ABC transporter ATP-binding protein [Thermoflexales bacterium]